MNVRIAHISDLHFTKISWNPRQFLSKRWIGNLNAAFSRKRYFDPERPYALINRFLELGVTHVVISGDVTTTARRKEFALARSYVNELEKNGLTTLIVPGNHDSYTKKSYKNRTFYRYFERPSLKLDCVAKEKLSEGLWAVSIDAALATPFYKSTGSFSKQIEENLIALLEEIPKSDKIVLINHFPLFNNDTAMHDLEGAERLQEIVQHYRNIVLYLHGHSHRHCIGDLRPNNFPILLDSGSVGLKNASSWNLIECEEKTCRVRGFFYDEESAMWDAKGDHTFAW